MAVDIDIELNSGNAVGEIAAIAAELQTLQAAGEGVDFDLDFGDLDIDNISDLVSQMEDLSDVVNNMDFSIDFSDLDELEQRLDNLNTEINLNEPSGSTGDGDSTGSDPPGGGGSSTFSKKRFEGKIADLIGADRDQVSLIDGLDSNKLNELSSDLQSTLSEGGVRNLGLNSLSGLPSDMSDSILVETESHGKVTPSMYRQIKRGNFPDSPDPRRQILKEAVANSPFDNEISFAKADRASQGITSTRAGSVNVPDMDLRDAIGKDSGVTNFGDFGIKKADALKDRIQDLGNTHTGLGKKLRKLKPSMSGVYNIIAAMIPVAISLGTQLLGVAAALGAVGAAGASIIGLGLLGHGETMAESMRMAQNEVQNLKEDLYETFQPEMQQFSSIQERMFDAIPSASGGIADEMGGLAQYEDTLFNLGSDFAGGIEEFFSIINRNEGAISQLSQRFGGLAGSKLLSFFEWLIQTADENQELMIELGASVMSIVEIIYNFSMAVGRIVAGMRPFLEIIAAASNHLSNRLVLGIIAAATAAAILTVGFAKATYASWVLLAALGKLLTSFGILGSGTMIGAISGFFTTLSIYIEAAIAHFTALELAALSAAAAIVATGVGAIVVGAGVAAAGTIGSMSGPDNRPPPGGGSGGNTYVDNRQFTVNNNGGGGDYASEMAMRDELKRLGNAESSMEPPNVTPSSSTSDGE